MPRARFLVFLLLVACSTAGGHSGAQPPSCKSGSCVRLRQIVSPNAAHDGLVLQKEALLELLHDSGIDSATSQVVVVAVVGAFHTGKSFLLNQLAFGGSGGFSVGTTVNPETLGLWAALTPGASHCGSKPKEHNEEARLG
eukprot:gnl/Hemi2/24659_TR8297_c0_g2_i1.p1 gnl/Hemi2/24659_TR8297_c0_g2~~gnl/Hemi2/24659_TR8297_c0_g2_i1.p1  ORF type:complete len:153 (-),score=43.89 gnl/Hemi2/24659_TR8297_c0_g2_i1:127-546(-)